MRTNVIHKIIGVPLAKGYEMTEDDTLVVRGYFTSDEVDALGDIITKDATINALPAYREWGNIRYMHQPNPVARMLRLGEDDDLAWNEIEIEVVDDMAIKKVKKRLLKALSVGIYFMWDTLEFTDEGGWIINDYALVEISLVDHPANYDAKLFLDEDEKGIVITSTMREQFVTKGFDSVVEGLRSLPVETEIMEEDILVEELVDTPEEETTDSPTEEEEIPEWFYDPETDEEDVVDEELVVEDTVEGEEIPEVGEEEIPEVDEEFIEEEVPEMAVVVIESDEEEPDSIEEISVNILSNESLIELGKLFLTSAIKDLATSPSLETPVEEAPVEQPEAIEEVEPEEDELTALRDVVDALSLQVVSLNEKLEDALTSTKRKGLLLTGILPHEEAPEEAVLETDLIDRAKQKASEESVPTRKGIRIVQRT